MKRKFLAGILALCMVMTLLPVSSLADNGTTPTDVETTPTDVETTPTDVETTPTDVETTPTDVETTPLNDGTAIETWEQAAIAMNDVPPAGYSADAESKTVKIASAEGLAWFAYLINDWENRQDVNFQDYTINITADIDLSAYWWCSIDAETVISDEENPGYKDDRAGCYNNKLLAGATIDGHRHTIAGMRICTAVRGPLYGSVPGDGQNAYYYAGLIGRATGELTIKNLTFTDAVVNAGSENLGSNGSSSLAVVVGLSSRGPLTLENVHLDRCTVEGEQKIGGFVGQGAGALNVKNCSITNCTFKAYWMAAPISAYATGSQYNNSSDASKNNINPISIQGVKLENNTVEQRNSGFETYTTLEDGGTYSDYSSSSGVNYWLCSCDTLYVVQSAAVMREDGTTVNCFPLAFDAEVDGYLYDSLADAVAAAPSGAVVKVLRDIELTEGADINGVAQYALRVDKSLTIDGGGNTLTLQTGRGIGILGENGPADVAINDLTVVQKQGRSCVETRGNIGSLTLTGVDFDCTEYKGNAQPLTIGGNQAEPAAVRIENSSITANQSGYCVITFNPVDLTVANSTLTGWAPLYFKGVDGSAGSAGTTAAVTGGSVLNSSNLNGAAEGWNNFGAIVFEDDNVAVRIEEAAVNVSSQSPNERQSVFSFAGKDAGNERTVTGCTVTIEEGAEVAYTGDRAVFVSRFDPAAEEDVYDAGGNTVTVNGGYFTGDVTAYCAPGKMAKENTDANSTQFGFKVAEVTEGDAAGAADVATAVVAGETAVTLGEGIDETQMESATAVAESVGAHEGENTLAAAETVSDSAAASEKAEAIVKLAASGMISLDENGAVEDENVTVTLVHEVYLDVTVTGLSESEVTLEIVPKYNLKATTDADNMTDENTVTLDTGKDLSVRAGSTIDISVTLPEDFAAEGETVYIGHKDYEYSAAAQAGGKLTFSNPHGFSEFAFSTTSSAVARVGSDAYTSFAAAVSAAPSGATVEVLQDRDLTATARKTLTIKNTLEEPISVTINSKTQTIAAGESRTFTYSTGSSASVPAYEVKLPESLEHGSVSASPERASSGRIVKLTVTPDEGYELESLTVTDAGGKAVDLTDAGDGTYTFTMPARAVTVAVVFAETAPAVHVCPSAGLTDVNTAEWYHEAVDYAVENGLMNGVGGGLFDPSGALDRAMMAQILWNLEGRPAGASGDYTDVAAGAWYHGAVLWASASGVVNGYPDGSYRPQQPITRQEMAAMLYRYAQYSGYDVSAAADLSVFADGAETSDWALPAMRWAVASGVMGGKGGGVLDPLGDATRAEVAQILMNFCVNFAG